MKDKNLTAFVVFRLFSGTDKVRLMADATMSVVRQLKKPLRHAHSTDDFLFCILKIAP
jgi:hypothetical protein